MKTDLHPGFQHNQHLIAPILLVALLLLVAMLRAPRLFTIDGVGGAYYCCDAADSAALALTPIVLVGRGGVDLSVGPLLGFINVTLVKWLVETGHSSPIMVVAYVVGSGVLYKC